MMILSIDTSSPKLSIALLKGEELISEFESQDIHMHCTALVPEIDNLLLKNSCNIKDIDIFCIGTGPGSFTGLRIGVSSVKGFYAVFKKPVIGIPSIDAIAYNLAGRKSIICPIIDAKQNKVYSRLYKFQNNAMKPLTDFLLLSIDELLKKIKEPAVFTGDGIRLYKEKILSSKNISSEFAPETFWYPKSAIIGRLGFERFKKGYRQNINKLAPLYIYPKECQIKK